MEIDFGKMYSNFKFEKKTSSLMKIFDERIKDTGSKLMMRQLKESPNVSESKFK